MNNVKPYEKWINKNFCASHLKTCGCNVVTINKKQNLFTFQQKILEMQFFGYDYIWQGYKGTKFIIPSHDGQFLKTLSKGER